ncbi:MAG: right-handed parallel beta-helix repeat-containing protein, partial [Planctomycetota bacterium]
ESGGGMTNTNSSLILTNCRFIGNSTRRNGGGMCNHETNNLTLANCVFIGNSAEEEGGGMYNRRSSPTLTNCTFSGNSADNSGGGMYNGGSSGPTITNCILWGDAPEEINIESGTIDVTYNDIQGGWLGEGNIDADPCFVDPDGADNIVGTEDDNLRLLLDSPCIDTGDNTAVPPSVTTDLDGKPRIIGDTVDMGAYEFWGPIYVDDDGPDDPGPGDPQISDPLENGTEDHPFDTIQEAIDLAVDWYTVLVRQGSYFEPAGGSAIDFPGKNITLKSEDPTDWDIIDNTVIRGYVQFSGTEDPNCKFAGFKIRNFEGAIYGNHTHATINHCNISGNGPCGATVIKDCDGTISNCLITDNLTFFYCGVYPVVFGCNGSIKNCTIANNISGVSVGTATIKNCIIYNNAGSQLGVGGSETLNISYCNLQGGLEGITGGGSVNRGPGNIDTDPCFVRAGYWEGDPLELIEGDYHLRSEGWRWNTEGKSWTYDYITSRCIDAGNPTSDLGGELMSVPRDPDNTWGVNLRINMGAFGGTGQASMPPHGWALPADLNNDGIVNYLDFAYQAQAWLMTAAEQPGDLNRDGVVNKIDLAALAETWLQVTVWVE